MYERFTDGARAAVKSAFCRQTTVCERDILIALNGSRGVAQLLMVTVGDVAGRLPNGGAMVEKRVLQLLPHLPDGITELYFHPATQRTPALAATTPQYRYPEELAALLSPAVQAGITEFGIMPVCWRDLH